MSLNDISCKKKIILYFRIITLVFVCFLYYKSLTLPAMGCTDFGADSGRYTVSNGFEMLICGWMGFLKLNFAWVANILFLIAVPYFIANRLTVAFNCSLVSILLGQSTFLLFAVEGEMHLFIGFYLWIASFVVLCAASFFLRKYSSH